MDDRFEKYNRKRADIIRFYEKRKWLETLLIGSSAVLLIIVINLLPDIFNIAVRLVASVMLGIFAILCIRIRKVTLDHRKQQKLTFLEQDEPIFHAKFK